MNWRRLSTWVAIALIGLYGWRAVAGGIGGLAYIQGVRLAQGGSYPRAIKVLKYAKVGEDTLRAVWLRAESLEGLWKIMSEFEDRTRANDDLLRESHFEFTRAITMSPAAGWYWMNLGELYYGRERLLRAERGVRLDLLQYGAWGSLGLDGRIAIGLTRMGIEREPNQHRLRDRLVKILWRFELHDDMVQAVRETAHAQPDFYVHTLLDIDPLPDEILDAFAAGSREMLGQVPFMSLSRHLNELGKLELRRGNWVQAEADLREALAQPTHALNRAAGHYNLGRALIEQGKLEEAAEAFDEARTHPNTEPMSLFYLARIAEESQQPEQALDLLRELRRLEPRNLSFLLEFARLAEELQQWEAAEQALRWARLVHPRDVAPTAALIGLYIDKGDLNAARMMIRESEQRHAELPEPIARLRRRIERPGPR